MGRTKKIQSSEADVIEEESNGTIIDLTPEQQKEYDNGIIKLSPGEEKVKEVQKYRELIIADIHDDEGIEKVRLAIADCRGYRQTIKPDVRMLSAPFKQIIKGFKEKGDWIESELLDVEAYLHSQKDPIDAEKDRITEEKKKLKAKRLLDRTQELTRLGASIVDGFFVLNEVMYSVEDISGLDDDIYNSEILPKYKAEWQKAEDARLAEQKIKDDAALELKKKQEEADERERKIKEREDAIEKAEKERNDLLAKQKKEKNDTRCKQLEAIGMQYFRSGNLYQYGELNIRIVDELEVWDDEKWNQVLESSKVVIDAKKKVFEADQKQKTIIELEGKARKRMLTFFKFTDSSKYTEDILGKMDEDAWLQLHSAFRDENTKKEHEKWLADEAEKKRLKDIEDQKKLDESSDNVKWKTVIDHLKATPIVEMKSKKYQGKWNVVRDFLSDIEAL